MEQFALGRLNPTQRVKDLMLRPGGINFVFDCLERHLRHDWGDLPREGHVQSDQGVREGCRITSCYTGPAELDEEDLCIITRYNRSQTIIFLADDWPEVQPRVNVID